MQVESLTSRDFTRSSRGCIGRIAGGLIRDRLCLETSEKLVEHCEGDENEKRSARAKGEKEKKPPQPALVRRRDVEILERG